MGGYSTLEIAQKYLYEDIDKIPEYHREKLKRLRWAFTYWYEYPTRSRREVKDYIIKEFPVSNQQAYDDIQVVEMLMGNIKNPSKAWMRYRVNSMLEAALEIAEKNKDAKAMALIADKIGKYNMLDQNDPEQIPFDQIVPQPFEPTDDPSVLGIKRDPDIREKRKKLIEKYSTEIDIEDVPFTDISDDQEQDDE